MIKNYESALDKGLTIFAPNDEAFKAKGVPDLTKLTSAEVVSLLLYHAASKYLPVGALKTSKDPISTLATNGAGKYEFNTTTAGDAVTLHTGVDSSRVASTVLDSTPLAIFTVDSVLLPAELFAAAPAPAPGNEPVSAPAPAEAPKAKAPAPAGASPAGAPADAPSAAADQSSPGKNEGAYVEASGVVAVLFGVICAVVLS